MKRIIYFIVSIMCVCHCGNAQKADGFDWRNATVYFVITDRFCNGDSLNDVNYGRIVDYGSEQMNAATFHGGDFKGMTEKANEGYFTKLGVDVVWMTDVYEQIHGWMAGSGSINDFPHYGYHGYYPLDYTQIDKNYGTVAEFKELVDTLHNQGIRVMLGANLNDPGYPTLLDTVQYGFAETGLTEKEAAQHIRDWSFDKFFEDRLNWNGWYDRGWIRMPDENWDETNPLEATLYGMPDFKDESNEAVSIPQFLKKKWLNEGTKNDEWVNPSARVLRTDREWSPSQYLIAWIASWVEEFGIDGFRCDIVENVHLNRWKELNEACNIALDKWRKNHPESPASKWKDSFFMTGDFEPSGIEYKPKYAGAGFSNMVNCNFPKNGDLDGIVYVWQAYSDSIAAHPGWYPFNYLNNSYHRDADMNKMMDCATTLLLAPGISQIFYGDETGRTISDARLNVDSAQAFRSDMNWNGIDVNLFKHFQKLCHIKGSHPVIGYGSQATLDTHTCIRYNDSDTVLIKLMPNDGETIGVAPYFIEGEILTDLYSGQKSTVNNGKIKFSPTQANVMVITRYNQ